MIKFFQSVKKSKHSYCFKKKGKTTKNFIILWNQYIYRQNQNLKYNWKISTMHTSHNEKLCKKKEQTYFTKLNCSRSM